MEQEGLISEMFTGIMGIDAPLQQQNLQDAQSRYSQCLQATGVPYSVSKLCQLSPVSDEDEHGFGEDSTCDGKRKASPWHRMKWTDNMVRMLITAVFCIGDECGPEEGGGKKKSSVLQQKKGKWKSVSMAMMEKGFYVSPQQCEDKFNDLNKRYKRVSDILGKETACKVVENQRLLDAIDMPVKMKEEARKLLNSKHLFFREMCAYHNGATATSFFRQQHCSHVLDNVHVSCNLGSERSNLVTKPSHEEDDEDHDSDDNGDDEYNTLGTRSFKERDEHDAKDDSCTIERVESSHLFHQVDHELTRLIQDESKSQAEKKHWMRMRLMQLEEQQVSYQYQAFQLEKRRLKWVKFSSKKEREMEKAKLENERRWLENERISLLIRQKQMELLHLLQHSHQQHSSSKKSDLLP